MVMLQNKIKMEPSFNEIFEYVHFLQTPSLTADIQVAATEERTRMGHGGLHEMLRTGSQGVEKILQEEEESCLDPAQTIKLVPLDYPDSVANPFPRKIGQEIIQIAQGGIMALAP